MSVLEHKDLQCRVSTLHNHAVSQPTPRFLHHRSQCELNFQCEVCKGAGHSAAVFTHYNQKHAQRHDRWKCVQTPQGALEKAKTLAGAADLDASLLHSTAQGWGAGSGDEAACPQA